MKSRLPSVCCPELSDIESYIRVIDRNGYFEGLVVSKDDLLRNKMYQTDIIRKRTESSFTDYNSYLKSLDMRAVIDVPKKSHYQRVTQLINKTNQFNLTTKRYSEVEVANYIQDTNNLSLYGSLKDKYGENGIVSVLMGHREEMVLYIDIFVSCRVFKRGMEDAMMNAYVNYASRQGIKNSWNIHPNCKE